MTSKTLRVILSVLALPFVVLVVIPSVLLLLWPTVPAGWQQPVFYLGVSLASSGLIVMIWTISLFVREGLGTLAPWDPPVKLVKSGPYRVIRNPMIAGVILVLLGGSLFFQSWPLGIYSALVVAANLLYFPLFEEKALEARYGEEYLAYKQAVPRWLPRVHGSRSGDETRD